MGTSWCLDETYMKVNAQWRYRYRAVDTHGQTIDFLLTEQRDEQAIAHWKRDTWPAIRKVRRLGASLAFLDESGFLLMPTRRRTWAPAGHTPIVTYNDKHDRLSTLAVLTVSPKRQHLGLYLRWQPRNFRALLRHLRGHVVLLWDRGTIHRGSAIEAVCKDHPRLHLEKFSAYAPKLNPTEQVWNDFKGHTANCLLWDTRDLCRRVQANVRRVCRSQAKLRSFILASDLPSPPPLGDLYRYRVKKCGWPLAPP